MMEDDKTNVCCIFNDFIIGPCESLNCLQKGLVRNPRGLIRIMGNANLLREVLLGFYCLPNVANGFWMLDLKILLSPNRGGGAIALVPQHHFDLYTKGNFIGAICILCTVMP